MIPNVLSIAGSDPSGGAGIQADLKTVAALGGYGMAALTALTAQNTRGVMDVHIPPAAFLAAQIDAVFDDVRVDAVKIGMLATAEIVETVADRLRRHRARVIVLDPVLVATSGDSLGAPGVPEAMRDLLMPLATVVTPNLPEAARLTGFPCATTLLEMETAARALVAVGARAALVKGGHLAGGVATDILFDGDLHRFDAARVDTLNTHGTGCTLSSAIATLLAHGGSLRDAVSGAKAFLTEALRHSHELTVGHGHGPVHHAYGRQP